jgi:hypothetical protein
MTTDKIVIDAKDVARLTGRTISASQKLLRRIRRETGKPARGYVTVAEFCTATGLPVGEVRAGL